MDQKIFADFNNADLGGRVRLITHGTLEDIIKHNIILKDGLEILLSDNDSLEIKGVVKYSQEEIFELQKLIGRPLNRHIFSVGS